MIDEEKLEKYVGLLESYLKELQEKKVMIEFKNHFKLGLLIGFFLGVFIMLGVGLMLI